MGAPDKNSPGKQKLLLLFATLDWGLGHTTRSIPLIRELLETGLGVVIACNSTQKKIFEEEIPQARFISLEGYNIRYGKTSITTRLLLLWQIRKILTKIKFESRWLEAFLVENSIAAVISDNRYGLYSGSVPCILITHQLSVRTGFGRLADRFVQKKLYRMIERFHACWVPDMEREKGSIAGELSHPFEKPNIPLRYLGSLSRFTACNETMPAIHPAYPADPAGPLLILLSGPEPQRSIFEQILFEQLSRLQEPAIIVRGLPHTTNAEGPEKKSAESNSEKTDAFTHPAPDTEINRGVGKYNAGKKSQGTRGGDTGKSDYSQTVLPPHCTVIEYAGASELNQLICAARLVICRPGYTTLMDMLKLRKKTVMVPTPGQGEQEYLAARAFLNKLALTMPQHRFSLSDALERATEFEYHFPDETDTTTYREVVRSFARSLLAQG